MMRAKLFCFCVLCFIAAFVHAAQLSVLSGGAMRPPLAQSIADYEKKTGDRVKVEYAPAGEITKRVLAGEHFDILIVPDENIAGYEKAGKVVAGSRTPLGKVGIGVGVKEGAPVPE